MTGPAGFRRLWITRGINIFEMMIPMAILGILAAIAIPKFNELVRKSNEGATKGNLGAMRSALSIFYGETGRRYPSQPVSLTFGKRYLPYLPKAKLEPLHPVSEQVRLGAGAWDVDDHGGWLYVADRRSETFGVVLVNCTHTDTKGKPWISY